MQWRSIKSCSTQGKQTGDDYSLFLSTEEIGRNQSGYQEAGLKPTKENMFPTSAKAPKHALIKKLTDQSHIALIFYKS